MAQPVKPAIVKILKEYRSLVTLADSEVQIDSLTVDDKKITAKGEYVYRTLWGVIAEKGSFEISLAKVDLEPVRVKINPTGRPILRA